MGVHAEAEALGVDLGALEQPDACAVLSELRERVTAEIVGEHLDVAEARDVRGAEGAERVPRGRAVAAREVPVASEPLEHHRQGPRILLAASPQGVVDQVPMRLLEVPRSGIGEAEEEAGGGHRARVDRTAEAQAVEAELGVLDPAEEGQRADDERGVGLVDLHRGVERAVDHLRVTSGEEQARELRLAGASLPGRAGRSHGDAIICSR